MQACLPACLQGVADMLATKGVKKVAAERALEALVAQNKLVGWAGTSAVRPCTPCRAV